MLLLPALVQQDGGDCLIVASGIKRSFVAADWNADGLVDRSGRLHALFRFTALLVPASLSHTHPSSPLSVVLCLALLLHSLQEGIRKAGSLYWRLCVIPRPGYPLQQRKPRAE